MTKIGRGIRGLYIYKSSNYLKAMSKWQQFYKLWTTLSPYHNQGRRQGVCLGGGQTWQNVSLLLRVLRQPFERGGGGGGGLLYIFRGPITAMTDGADKQNKYCPLPPPPPAAPPLIIFVCTSWNLLFVFSTCDWGNSLRWNQNRAKKNDIPCICEIGPGKQINHGQKMTT